MIVLLFLAGLPAAAGLAGIGGYPGLSGSPALTQVFVLHLLVIPDKIQLCLFSAHSLACAFLGAQQLEPAVSSLCPT